MAITVNIHEAKTHLSRLIEQVLHGESVVISKAGAPVVDLVVHRPRTIEYGHLHGQLRYDDRDFAQPDPEVLAMFYGSDAAR